MPPEVSVIVPAYNAARYLPAALDSALAQTGPALEVIVVDDGSTDATAAVLSAYAARPNVTLLTQANAGVAAARNRALAAAAAPLVAILDADDVWRPGYLAALTAALAADPGAVAAFAGWQYLDAASTPLPQQVVLPASAAATLPADLLWSNALIPSAAVVRRAALAQVGGFDPALAGTEDWDLWLRLAPLGRFIVVPEALVLYRTHAENTSDRVAGMEVNTRKLLVKHLGPLPADPAAGPAPVRRALGALFFNAALGYFRQGQAALAHAKLADALRAWPAYLEQPEFYYELACAFQPRGRRGQPGEPGIEQGAALLQAVVRDGSVPPAAPAQRLGWWGYACLVLAQLSADPRQRQRYAARALRLAPSRHKSAAFKTWLRAALRPARSGR